MNKNQSKYVRMFLNTQEILNVHTEKWSGIPVMVNAKNEFDELIQRILDVNERTQSNSEAVSASKAQTLEAVVQKAVMLSGAMQAFAAFTGNVELAGKVKLTKTDIVGARETDVEKTVAPVINAARKELANLADYGITEAQITELETSVDDFNSMIGRPRTIRNQAFAAISELQELVDTANGVANQKLDNLMLLFQAAQPGFFEEYKRARVIVD
jgi:hypothetical protein